MFGNAVRDIKDRKRVCVIGAGTAGLCALKHSIDHHMEVTCFEQSKQIGGTWIYTDKIPEDPSETIHSSMYEGLRTNLPKEVMGFPDFPYPDSIKESFITSPEVLHYLQSYAEHYKLYDHIKLEHEVIRVRPRKGEWEVYVKDLKVGRSIPYYFDFIFVCNGHYSEPDMPEIAGMDIYRGRQMHSHLYRKPNMFKDANVLIIGAGPSGMDIANQISKVANKVFLSHHLKESPKTDFMKKVTHKPDVEYFTENGAVFKDGSVEEFTFAIYCTGYKYSFPCISSDAGFRVSENWVNPLWKHCIVIKEPTMALIGLPFKVIPTAAFDLQVRFVLKFYSGQIELPSEEDMMADMEQEMGERWEQGLSKKRAHEMGERQFDYYNSLCTIAGIKNIKPVMMKMMKDCGQKYIYELETYRNNYYRIIDDDHFVKFPLIKT